MSMNLFLQAFPQQDVDAMQKDHALVDKWVRKRDRCAFSTDIGTAWDLLNGLLSGAGFEGGTFLDDVLWNGCTMLSAGEVKEHAAELSAWKTEDLVEELKELGEGADFYHLEIYQEEPDGLVEEFNKLVDFYRKAADQGLAAIHYAA